MKTFSILLVGSPIMQRFDASLFISWARCVELLHSRVVLANLVLNPSNCWEGLYNVNGITCIDWMRDFSWAWWRHQMETFSALLALCEGNSLVPVEFPTQRPVTRSFDVFFDLGLNKRLSKQLWGWWFETHSPSLWRRCNDIAPCRFVKFQ